MLIENLEEEIEPVLDPLIGRLLIKRGKAIKLGDKEVEYSPKFQLFLHTKLANPHYKPGKLFKTPGRSLQTLKSIGEALLAE